jgi:hypothetical protein
MQTAGWATIVLNVPARLVERSVGFWSAVTGWAPDHTITDAAQTVALAPGAGDGWLAIRAAADVASASVAVEAHAVGDSTARRGRTHTRSPGGLTVWWTALRGRPRFDRESVGSSVLDQVCVDIPVRWWDDELRYWTELTGRELERRGDSEFAFLGDPDPAGGIRILLQRLGSPEPAVRAHPDLAVADRAAETSRHVRLGAETVAVREHWTVMRAPDGHVYCLTDRDPATGRAHAARGR